MIRRMRLAVILLAVLFAAGTVSHVTARTSMSIAMTVEADTADGVAGQCTLCPGTDKTDIAACDLVCSAPVAVPHTATGANPADAALPVFGFPADHGFTGRDTRLDPRPPRTIIIV